MTRIGAASSSSTDGHERQTAGHGDGNVKERRTAKTGSPFIGRWLLLALTPVVVILPRRYLMNSCLAITYWVLVTPVAVFRRIVRNMHVSSVRDPGAGGGWLNVDIRSSDKKMYEEPL
jgi:hypothetical protein